MNITTTVTVSTWARDDTPDLKLPTLWDDEAWSPLPDATDGAVSAGAGTRVVIRQSDQSDGGGYRPGVTVLPEIRIGVHRDMMSSMWYAARKGGGVVDVFYEM